MIVNQKIQLNENNEESQYVSNEYLLSWFNENSENNNDEYDGQLQQYYEESHPQEEFPEIIQEEEIESNYQIEWQRLNKWLLLMQTKSVHRSFRECATTLSDSCHIFLQDSLKKEIQFSEEYNLLNIPNYNITNYSDERKIFSSAYLSELITNYSVIILTKEIFNKLVIENNTIFSSKSVILHCPKSFSHNILEQYRALFSGSNFCIINYANFTSDKREAAKEENFKYTTIEERYKELYSLASHYIGELNKVREDIHNLPEYFQKKHIDLGIKKSSRYIKLGEDGMYYIDEQLLQKAVEEDQYSYLHAYPKHLYEEYCKYLGEENVEYKFSKVDDTDSYRELRKEVKGRLHEERKEVYNNVLNDEECSYEHLKPVYECTKKAVNYIKKTLEQFLQDQDTLNEQTSFLLEKGDSSMYNIYKYTYQAYHELLLRSDKKDHQPVLTFIRSYVKRCDGVTQEHAANILNKCFKHLKMYYKFYITPQRAKEIIEEFYELEVERRNGKVYFHLIPPIII